MQREDLKAVCSVSEMARKVSLSRARFYQLQKNGVFPKPVYLHHSGRPFYTLDLQQKCVEVRKTGIGFNGKPIIFNSTPRRKYKNSHHLQNPIYEPFVEILNQLGQKVTCLDVKDAVKLLFPKGLEQTEEGVVLRDLFKYFRKGLYK
ncbi:MAG: helix-turn-helix transcriptional regulator [Planctomycetota bacterium]|jgi:hypothetical protein